MKLIYFTAHWCSACRAIAPLLMALEAEHPSLIIVRVDTDESPDIARHYAVRSLPTLMLVDAAGAVVNTHHGMINRQALREFVGA